MSAEFAPVEIFIIANAVARCLPSSPLLLCDHLPPALCALHVHSPLCSSCCPLLPTPPFSPSSPCAQPSLLQLLPSAAEPSGEEVFIADSLNGIQLSHIKKALADAGETCHAWHTSHHTSWARWQTQVGRITHLWRARAGDPLTTQVLRSTPLLAPLMPIPQLGLHPCRPAHRPCHCCFPGWLALVRPYDASPSPSPPPHTGLESRRAAGVRACDPPSPPHTHTQAWSRRSRAQGGWCAGPWPSARAPTTRRTWCWRGRSVRPSTGSGTSSTRSTVCADEGWTG